MPILSDSDLKAATAATPYYLFMFQRAAISSQLAGGFSSLWRGTAYPVQGAIPTTAATCVSGLAGSPTLPTKTVGATLYASSYYVVAGGPAGIFIYDRLAHMGGLSGTSTAAQTVSVSASTAQTQNRCLTDYSNCEWFLEWYTATGSTAVTATVAVTYNDDSTGNVSVAISATFGASRMLPIYPAVNGKYIKQVNTVTLSATTGTVGSFGVTVGRKITSIAVLTAAYTYKGGWSECELAEIQDNSCLWLVQIPANTSTSTVLGNMTFIQK